MSSDLLIGIVSKDRVLLSCDEHHVIYVFWSTGGLGAMAVPGLASLLGGFYLSSC